MANGYQSIMERLLAGSRQNPYTERVNMRPSWGGGTSFKPWEHGFDDRYYQRASPGPEASPTQYMAEAMTKPGWDRDWDKYQKTLGDYVSGQRKGVNDDIPQGDWRKIANWYEKSGMPGYDTWKKDQYNQMDPYTERVNMRPWGDGTSFSPWEHGFDDRNYQRASPSDMQPWGGQPNSRRPPEMSYVAEASNRSDWDPKWNKYRAILTDYIGGKRSSVTEGGGAPYGGGQGQGVIPQKDWQEIANWYEKSGMPGFDDWKKQQKPTQQNSLIQLLTMLQNQGQQQQPKTINDRLLGPDRAAMEKYNQEQGMLQNMARRNSRKRQALSNILNMSQRNASQYGYMPSGGSSGGTLMDLFSQQQNQSLQNQFKQLGPNPQDEYAMWLQQQRGLDRPY